MAQVIKLSLLTRKRASLEASSVSMTGSSRLMLPSDAFLVRPNVTPNRLENKLCKLIEKERSLRSNHNEHSLFKAQLFRRS